MLNEVDHEDSVKRDSWERTVGGDTGVQNSLWH
jgi:hypothetical protein